MRRKTRKVIGLAVMATVAGCLLLAVAQAQPSSAPRAPDSICGFPLDVCQVPGTGNETRYEQSYALAYLEANQHWCGHTVSWWNVGRYTDVLAARFADVRTGWTDPDSSRDLCVAAGAYQGFLDMVMNCVTNARYRAEIANAAAYTYPNNTCPATPLTSRKLDLGLIDLSLGFDAVVPHLINWP